MSWIELRGFGNSFGDSFPTVSFLIDIIAKKIKVVQAVAEALELKT
jgi:hypothetical protein